ncbi:MAG: hypothetical protein ACI9UA_001266 [Pseudoalteromonas tetraodonis]|jgi:hypothetical protein
MLLCRFRQFRISSALDDGRELPEALKSHAGSCQSCQQFLTRSQALAEELRASVPMEDPPAWLHMKIMAKVRSSEAAPSTSERWIPVVAGAAAIAIAFAVVNMNVNPPAENTQLATVQLSAPTTPIHPASVTAKIERHAKNTLNKEFQDIAADISGARNFLSASLRNTIPGMRED